MFGDHQPVVRRQALVELAADGVGPAQVRGVEFPYGFDGLGQDARPEPVAAAPADRVDRLQRTVEAQQVQVLKFSEQFGQAALAHREHRVLLLDVQPPLV